LGAGPIITSYVPVQVTGLSNITAISSGWAHILALKADGTVWAWGLNAHGEVGDGTSINRSNAVQVLNVTNIVSVSGGDDHSSALCADGTLWKWGQNDVGELGLGTTNNSPNPVPAKILVDKFGSSFTNIVIMSARDYHNIAVKADGSVWMWGANDQGQCGDGTTNDDWRPTLVTGLGPRVGLSVTLTPGIQPGYANLSWSSSTGEFFTIEYTTDLASGFTNSWQSNILATPPTNTASVPVTAPRGFYRLKF
ncbi:MAG: RCC1 domain-containing protein, partial [Limisphaerales bacterium]